MMDAQHTDARKAEHLMAITSHHVRKTAWGQQGCWAQREWMTDGLVAHGWLWGGLSYSNAPDSGRIGGSVWVAGETLSRDQWTSTFPCGGLIL